MSEELPIYTPTSEEEFHIANVKAQLARSEQQIRDLQETWGEHKHQFFFSINSNHGAIRGCMTCGATWATIVQGHPDTLQWHPIRESDPLQG